MWQERSICNPKKTSRPAPHSLSYYRAHNRQGMSRLWMEVRVVRKRDIHANKKMVNKTRWVLCRRELVDVVGTLDCPAAEKGKCEHARMHRYKDCDDKMPSSRCTAVMWDCKTAVAWENEDRKAKHLS